jgi:two-component system sensor histidine kinase SenX3
VQLILALNAFVLLGFILFLLREEWRFRTLSRRILETKQDLILLIHQLRSPLSNVRKYNDFLQTKEFGSLSFAQQEAMSKIKLSLAESLIVLDRIFARSYLEQDSVALQPTSLDMKSVITGALHAVTAPIKNKKHTVIVNGSKNVKIFADPILLHGIFDEIITNALHYTPSGGKITIAITQTKNTVSVSVTDTGIGISEVDRARVFEKFFRGEKARLLHAGNGLGLSFAKDFARKLNGSVRFSSKEGKGSTFTVSLPTRIKSQKNM